jgi:hypothetical protein
MLPRRGASGQALGQSTGFICRTHDDTRACWAALPMCKPTVRIVVLPAIPPTVGISAVGTIAIVSIRTIAVISIWTVSVVPVWISIIAVAVTWPDSDAHSRTSPPSPTSGSLRGGKRHAGNGQSTYQARQGFLHHSASPSDQDLAFKRCRWLQSSFPGPTLSYRDPIACCGSDETSV